MLAPLYIYICVYYGPRAGFVSSLISRRCCPVEIEFHVEAAAGLVSRSARTTVRLCRLAKVKKASTRVKGPRELNRSRRLSSDRKRSTRLFFAPDKTHDDDAILSVLPFPSSTAPPTHRTHAGPIPDRLGAIARCLPVFRYTRYKRYNTGLSTTRRTLIDPVVQHNVGDD